MPGTNAHRWDGEYEFGSPWREDEFEADELDDDQSPPDADETDVRPCPACGMELYAEADLCPVCGEFIIDDPARSEQQPGWRKLLIVLLIIGLLLGAGLGAVIW